VNSIRKSDAELRLLELVEPFLKERGFRAVDVDCRTFGKGLARIFVDATLDQCAEISRGVEPLLDASDLFAGPYDLEVSTPGLDRRLRLKTDFETYVGGEVKFELAGKVEGLGAKARGQLLKVEEDKILVKVSGKEVQVPLENIARANAIWAENRANQ
jgi:ribosome maturation factor RimP